MDEATSALDNATQKQIISLIENLECTRIMIAHRLSTIKQCSRIVILKNGIIEGDGTYNELYEQNPLFKEMVDTQTLSSV